MSHLARTADEAQSTSTAAPTPPTQPSGQRLAGKVAIVTGGCAGFGFGIAKKFVQEGAQVMIVDINKDKMKSSISELRSFSSTSNKSVVDGYFADVTNHNHWEELLDAVLKTFGKLDVVVNNAGIVNDFKPSHEVDEETFDRIMKVNVKPLHLSCRVVVPYFKKQGGGLFINMSSISEPRPRPKGVWYAASKGAVTVTTRGLAVEYAEDNIRYNCIRPAVGETAMLPSVLGGLDTPEGRTKVLGTIPLGRVCQPQDVANMACFLASDEALYLTGGCYDVDGGRGV